MITTVSSYHLTSYRVTNFLHFFLLMRTLKIYSLSNFQIFHKVLLTIVTMEDWLFKINIWKTKCSYWRFYRRKVSSFSLLIVSRLSEVTWELTSWKDEWGQGTFQQEHYMPQMKVERIKDTKMGFPGLTASK